MAEGKNNLNNVAAEYLASKRDKVSPDMQSSFNHVLAELSIGSINLADPGNYKQLQNCFGGKEASESIVPKLKSLHQIALNTELKSKIEQAKQMSADLVEYAGSINIEKKKLIKEKKARGEELVGELSASEEEEVMRRHSAGIDKMTESYKALRSEIRDLESAIKESGKSVNVDQANEPTKSGRLSPISLIIEKIVEFLNQIVSSITGNKSGMKFDKEIDKMMIEAKSGAGFDRFVDYNVQSQIAQNKGNTLDLMCYPQYQISGLLGAYNAIRHDNSPDAMDMKYVLAEQPLPAIASVLRNEVSELINGKPGRSDEEIRQRYGENFGKTAETIDRYNELKADIPAKVDSSRDLQILYGNILVLEQEANAFIKVAEEDGVKVDVSEYKTSLQEAKQQMHDKAQEKGWYLSEIPTPTLTAEINVGSLDRVSECFSLQDKQSLSITDTVSGHKIATSHLDMANRSTNDQSIGM